MKINLSKLMKKAWALYRKAAKKAAITFSEALRKAWAWAKVQASNAAKVEAAAAGIDEVIHSWSGWQAIGRMVIHGEEAALKVEVDDPTTRTGKRVKSFFRYSQTQAAPAA